MIEALESAETDGRSLSVSSLAEAIGVDQPRASRLVQEGVERGLVRRIPDPSDARRALIQLSTAGRSLLQELRSHRRSAVETALAGFTPEEARTFAELFDRFVRAWPRPGSDSDSNPVAE
jgi:DNA-binding MarR family transcriptional regulator